MRPSGVLCTLSETVELCIDCCVTLATTLLASDILWRLFFCQSTSAYSALGALAIMCYTDLRFTYLCTLYWQLCHFRYGVCSRQSISLWVCDAEVSSCLRFSRCLLPAVCRAQNQVSKSTFHTVCGQQRWSSVALMWCWSHDKFLMGNRTPWQNYGASYKVDYTKLLATQHKWTHPTLTTASDGGARFTYPGGMEGKVDLDDLILFIPRVDPTTALIVSDALTTALWWRLVLYSSSSYLSQVRQHDFVQ